MRYFTEKSLLDRKTRHFADSWENDENTCFRPQNDPLKKKSYRPLLNYEGGKEVRVESGGFFFHFWHQNVENVFFFEKIVKKVTNWAVPGVS